MSDDNTHRGKPLKPRMITKKVEHYYPLDLLARLDSYCAQKKRKRSRVVREAVTQYLEKEKY